MESIDFDQECFTRANVAYSRATNLTILACPLNMQGMPGALQVLAALLRGVQTIHTTDTRQHTGQLTVHKALLPYELALSQSAWQNIMRAR